MDNYPFAKFCLGLMEDIPEKFEEHLVERMIKVLDEIPFLNSLSSIHHKILDKLFCKNEKLTLVAIKRGYDNKEAVDKCP